MFKEMDATALLLEVEREIELILKDSHVDNWKPDVTSLLVRFAIKEAINLITVAVGKARMATECQHNDVITIERSEAESAVLEFTEEIFTHPDNYSDMQEMAREINSLAIRPFPTDPGVQLPTDALLASNWHIQNDLHTSVDIHDNRPQGKFVLSDFIKDDEKQTESDNEQDVEMLLSSPTVVSSNNTRIVPPTMYEHPSPPCNQTTMEKQEHIHEWSSLPEHTSNSRT